jgi:carbon-monoxide dehydrogenase medium subunit
MIGGGIQVRNRGTIGGAACAANPVYDYAPCLVAAGAEFLVVSTMGPRRIPADEFFRDAYTTALRPGELLVEIVLPAFGPQTGAAYQKLTFSDGCYNIASAACLAQVDAAGVYRLVRLAVGGTTPVPIRLLQAEAALAGARPSAEAFAEAGVLAEEAVIDPISDVMADGAYRRAMAGVMVRRALASATERARRAGAGDRRR